MGFNRNPATEQDGLLALPLLKEEMQIKIDRIDDIDKQVTTRIYVGGICCPSEVGIIEHILTPLPGVLKVCIVILHHFEKHCVRVSSNALCQGVI